ncbi:ricin-type beta-trefoil lectin domain protein [Longispora urticae]
MIIRRIFTIAATGALFVLIPSVSQAATPEQSFTMRSLDQSQCLEQPKGQRTTTFVQCDTGSRRQLWQFPARSDDGKKIAIARGQKCLTTMSDVSDVVLRKCDDSRTSQIWQAADGDGFSTFTNTKTGSCLSNNGGSLIAAPCGDSDSTHWELTSASK